MQTMKIGPMTIEELEEQVRQLKSESVQHQRLYQRVCELELIVEAAQGRITSMQGEHFRTIRELEEKFQFAMRSGVQAILNGKTTESG